mmetsp:Transcript_25792/g.72857  ORF Transcript_25792/g.72857 Transcript_25792/m.72857 type:complete len:582 (+) Transcript_25792:75-1820(+)
MVEITFDAVDSNALPKDLYLSMRIGETQKFAKATQSKIFKFPGASASDRRWAKLEVYRRIGVCSLDVEPEKLKGTHEVQVQVDDGRVADHMMKYHVSFAAAADAKKSSQGDLQRRDSNGATMTENIASAHDYLSKYQLEQRISDAMRAVLRDRPEEDPGAFVARMLLSGAGRLTKLENQKNDMETTCNPFQAGAGEELKAKARGALAGALLEAPAKQAPADDALKDVKKAARNALEKAFLGGAKEQSLLARPDAQEKGRGAHVEQLRRRSRKMFSMAVSKTTFLPRVEKAVLGEEESLKSKARGALAGALLSGGDEERSEEELKSVARSALDGALLSGGDGQDGEHVDEEEVKRKARAALDEALGVSGQPDESDDEEDILAKAREALDNALLLTEGDPDDDDEILEKARNALDLALLHADSDDEADKALIEKARKALDLALLDGTDSEDDPHELIERARQALDAALLGGEAGEAGDSEDEEGVKEKARDALDNALLSGEGGESEDEEGVKEKARAALDNALLTGDGGESGDEEDVKEKARNALDSALLSGEGNLPGEGGESGDEETLKEKARDALTGAFGM